MKHNKAFSLVELSITLIVVGLLTGTIVTAKKLISQTKLTRVISDVEEIKASIKTFILAHDAFPGDMANAHDYWGSNCNSTASKCNGDGNEQIDYDKTKTDDSEVFRSFQHLYLAEMIDFNSSGTAATAGVSVVGANSMPSPLDNAGYSLLYNNISYGGNYPNINAIHLGTDSSNNANYKFGLGAALYAADTYKIDSKIDDGIPTSGQVWSGNGGNGAGSYLGCRIDDDTYDLDATSPTCSPLFLIKNYLSP